MEEQRASTPTPTLELSTLESSAKYGKGFTPLTKYLYGFAIISIVLVNLVLLLKFAVAWKNITLYHTFEGFLKFREATDSWNPMIQAFNYLQNIHEKPLYSEIFFNQRVKFQYAPTSLLVIYILKKIIPGSIACNGNICSLSGVAAWLSWIFVVITAIFTTKIFNISLERNLGKTIKEFSKINLISRAIIIICFTLTFYPVINSYTLGQIQTWINGLAAILIWCWMKNKKGSAGIVAGIICLIKPQYIIIFSWGILRKQWNFILTFTATCLLGLLASILLFGLDNNLEYLNVLSFLSKHGETYYDNQSVNGLLNRLLFNGKNYNLVWKIHSFPPFNPIVYAGTTISAIAIIFLALLPPRNRDERGSDVDLAIIILTCTIASPIAWTHHYGILLPLYALLLPYFLTNKIFNKMTIPYLGISYILASNQFETINRFAPTPFNFLQSYLLAAALMVLISLYLLRSARVKKSLDGAV